jgi:hypothetical protein
MKPSRRQIRRRRLWAALGVLAALAACVLLGLPLYFFYDGEGSFEDHGPLAKAPRYEIDLGAIDLNHAGKHTWRLRHLPGGRFLLAVALEERLPATPPGAPPDAGRLKIDVVDANGHSLFGVNAPLGEWTEKSNLRFIEDSPESPGTRFNADPFDTVTVDMEVLVPMTTRARARLVVQSVR